MNEIQQLREHIDKRCNSQDAKLDNLLVAIRGDGIGVEGLAAKTAKNTHDINGMKLTVPALAERVTKVEHKTQEFADYMSERKDDRKWRNRLIIGAIVAVCGSTATSIALAVKASVVTKGTP